MEWIIIENWIYFYKYNLRYITIVQKYFTTDRAKYLIHLIIQRLLLQRKRQIFREQVLPALSGKIPEEAFRTDRLALNRLNKEGITIPDGVVLDAQQVHKHLYSNQRMPEIIKARLHIFHTNGITFVFIYLYIL